MTQSLVTSAIPIPIARADDVDRLLEKLVPEVRHDGAIRGALRAEAIHFLSVTVVRGEKDEPTYLVFEINADGDADAVVRRLEAKLRPWLDRMFETAGLGAHGDPSASLSRHMIRTGQGLLDVPGLDFPGTPGLSVERILAEHNLARAVRTYLDTQPSAASPLAMFQRIRDHIASLAEFEAYLTPAPVNRLPGAGKTELDASFVGRLIGLGLLKFGWPVLAVLGLAVLAATYLATHAAGGAVGAVTFVVAMIVATASLFGVVIAAYLGLRRLEGANQPDDQPPEMATMTEIATHENRSQQNHLAGISRMQPGLLRGLTLRIALWVIAQLVAKKFRPGFLGEIDTIHFARWVRLPKTNKLLFFSNYGGSWESYLEDFITKAAFGLTGVWSNTQGFPLTRNLFFSGATDGDRFKRWARRQQQPTRFWYSAYPHLTTRRIRINAALRQGLGHVSTEDEAAAWLGLFGSRVRPATLLETTEIQTLVFGGLGKHPAAAALLVCLPRSQEAARMWLAALERQITFGDEPPKDRVLILAFTERGLSRLGLPDETRAAFPVAFRMGMGSPTRSDILADTGDDKPADWLWGGPGREVDAALLIYARDTGTLDTAVAGQRDALESLGGLLTHQVTLAPLPAPQPGGSRVRAVREPFGFVDGVSQPIIKGTRRWLRQSDVIHTVEPGEVVLGYPDGRGHLPPSPSVSAESDGRQCLSRSATADLRGMYQPYFDGSGDVGARDLGRNGTFLVIRQLEQDVGAFNDYLARSAETHADHPAVPPGLDGTLIEEWIGAKMVGRWRNGTSLVRYPHRPGKARDGDSDPRPDNEFLYGAEDPIGNRCPLGAHIRRTNPRESLSPGSPDELSIVNRHRILRVGRTFDAAGSGDPAAKNPGLLFMCLNADIERQFEFVQQTWAMSWQFHGLENEVDPILGRGGKMGRLTIPSPRGPLHLTGIQDFVRMRGGGYFFMPSRGAIRYLSALGGAAAIATPNLSEA